jgi:hypothetical protein
MSETARRSTSTSNLSYFDDEDEDPSLEERALWDGLFWLEATMAMVRSVEWLQLGTVVEGVREEAFRAGIWLANPSPSRSDILSSRTTDQSMLDVDGDSSL